MQDLKTFTVYKGEENNILVYIGTTIQKPSDRFRWHKANGKDFKFTILHQYTDVEEMLDKEFELITLHKPKYNKITDRKQNLNVKLVLKTLQERKGNLEWCQKCLKRRAKYGNKCHCCRYY